jgi:hypothetical protein
VDALWLGCGIFQDKAVTDSEFFEKSLQVRNISDDFTFYGVRLMRKKLADNCWRIRLEIDKDGLSSTS